MRRRFLMKDVAIVVLICLLVISVGLNVGLYRKIQSEKTWISGYVKDTVVGAIIKARTSTAKGVSEKSTITDVDGYYELILSAGEWNVTVSMDYETIIETKTIFLADGEHKVLNFTMPAPPPAVSPYLGEFRSHPELFISHTKILHILFQDESGNRLGNLTSIYEVKRDGYTLFLNINHSFTCDSSIQNLTFVSGVVWAVTEGTIPVPMPTPIPQNVTLRNGGTAILSHKEWGSWEYQHFEESWEYVQININTCLHYFQIQFSDGQKWKSGENVYFCNGGVSGDLFALLYLNKVEVETETVQIKTV